MKNKHAFIAFTALLLLVTVNCYAQNARALIGKWFFEDLEGTMCIMEFTQTQVIFYPLEDDEDDSEATSYRADSTTIIIDGETMRYTIQNGNVLILSTPDGDRYTGKKVQANVTVLTGKYQLVNDVGFIEMLEFLDRSTVRLHMEVLGRTARPTYQYKINGNRVIISDPKDSMILEIIGDTIIKGNTFGGLGGDSVFVKR
jgi:hypothetical protein